MIHCNKNSILLYDFDTLYRFKNHFPLNTPLHHHDLLFDFLIKIPSIPHQTFIVLHRFGITTHFLHHVQILIHSNHFF